MVFHSIFAKPVTTAPKPVESQATLAETVKHNRVRRNQNKQVAWTAQPSRLFHLFIASSAAIAAASPALMAFFTKSPISPTTESEPDLAATGSATGLASAFLRPRFFLLPLL